MEISSEVAYAVVGGLIGAVVGIIGMGIWSNKGLRWFEKWRENHLREALKGSRKPPFKKLLKASLASEGRSLETLARITGTTEEECRLLLQAIKAKGEKSRQENKDGKTAG